ncbi:MAG: nicotinamide mononucleotide transporter [Clostridiales bacterium]|nr:nicotinamide mononucleotide transporter [Clostridiales bacterium]
MLAKIKKLLCYFSAFEWSLWSVSVLLITLSFFLGGEFYPLTLIASLVGVTALIFLAKGNVIGQFILIIFSILYAIISLRFRYYGEMITYLFMSAPAAVFACISWLKHPSKAGKSEVQIAKPSKKTWGFTLLFSMIATALFYMILKYFNTENLILSTISVATSFFASALVFLRSPYYAVAYAANDLVLIGLWLFASLESVSYLPMVLYFIAFLCNDLYGFYSWKKMEKRQNNDDIL